MRAHHLVRRLEVSQGGGIARQTPADKKVRQSWRKVKTRWQEKPYVGRTAIEPGLPTHATNLDRHAAHMTTRFGSRPRPFCHHEHQSNPSINRRLARSGWPYAHYALRHVGRKNNYRHLKKYKHHRQTPQAHRLQQGAAWPGHISLPTICLAHAP